MTDEVKTLERDETPARASRSKTLVTLVVLAACGAVVFAALAVRHREQVKDALSQAAATGQPRATGIPADVPSSLADLMALSPVPAAQAPGFTLVDQDGRTLALAGLRGHPVVLEFMDPHCTDVCPIVSQEFIDAYRELGPSSDVVFLAVNVNAYHHSVADMAAYSNAQRLNTVPTWHFLTGDVSSLEAVWHAYNVAVSAPSPDADIVHTSVVYFIDPQGRERYVAIPMIDHTAAGTAYLPAGPLTSWGHGIALVASSFGS